MIIYRIQDMLTLQFLAAGCVTGEFTCESGECIVIDQYCDGDLDCTDGSDEPSGCSKL